MNWQNNDTDWLLTADDTPIIKIAVREKPGNPVYTVIVKILYADLILGKQKRKQLKQKKHSWRCQVKKKFKTSADAGRYIEQKKEELIRYIAGLGI